MSAMESNAELLTFAQDYASKNVDLYDLLGVDALTPKEDIHRAWRKQSLRCHPDKAGDNFDEDKWQLLERARDVLSDPAARATYDGGMKAALLRKQERETMDKKRKDLVDDLESRENAWKKQREEEAMRGRVAMDKERARLAELQRVREDEEKRQTAATQEMEDLAEAKRRLKERKEKKKQDEARETFLKKARKAAAATGSGGSGPELGSDETKSETKRSEPVMDGMITVPGDYVVDLSGDDKRKYWELVCDKLRAVQAVKNAKKREATAEEYDAAEQGVREAKMRIHQAEVKFAEEAAMS